MEKKLETTAAQVLGMNSLDPVFAEKIYLETHEALQAISNKVEDQMGFVKDM
jgi:hypothetical protein